MTTTKIDLQKLRKHLAHHMKTTHQVTTTVEDALSEMGAYDENLTQAIKHAEKIISKAIKPDNIETLDTQKLTIRINRQLAARGYDEDTIQSAIYQACTNLITDIH